MSSNIGSGPAFLQQQPISEGVHILSPIDNDFEMHYLSLRRQEGWLIPDDVLTQLPETNTTMRNADIWKLRRESVAKLFRYLSTQKAPGKILEIGCGNGWFCNRLKQQFPSAEVIGLDINFTELSQAARTFQFANMYWVYGDIFENILSAQYFDLIIFNGSIQYFQDLKGTLSQSLSLLQSGGSIHILDSPFYHSSEKEHAENRSREYFNSMKHPSMQRFYHAHTFEALHEFSPDFLYRSSRWNKLINRFRKHPLNPLPWLKIQR